MYNFVSHLLHTRHFKQGSRERLQATLLSLVMLLATLVMLFDVYESIRLNYKVMSFLEGGSAIVLMVVYGLFPKRLSLKRSSYIVIFTIGILFILSLTIDGANPQLALFWLATLPIHLFFFFGLKEGILFTLIVVGLLLLTFLNTIYGWIPPLYSESLIFQLIVGYMAISYLLYTLEAERQGYEESLVMTANQKDILLKEVHHRTKNNMQVMMALLETQSFKIDNLKYKQMFQTHVDRLKAMALVHEHLYKGEHYERVAIEHYLEEILKNLQPLTSHTIVQNVEPLVCDMKIAMNIGLIYNEALHNAIAHAYEEGEEGIIEVSLKREDSDYVLRIQDRGKGFDVAHSYATLGVTLMEDIASSLPCGKLEIDSQEGTLVKVSFALEVPC